MIRTSQDAQRSDLSLSYEVRPTKANVFRRSALIVGMLLTTLSIGAFAQWPVPTPGGAPKRVLLVGGTAHCGNGKVIETSAIGLADGKITFIMDSRGFKPARDAFDTIINIDGKHVYPGFIAMGSQLGISEVELVRATNDNAETGVFNPSARTLIAYNTDSKVIPTVRSNGILMAQVAPQGGTICGQSSVMQLDGWNWEDAVVKADEGMWMNWPSMRIYRSQDGDKREEQEKRYQKSMEELDRFFREAQSYCTGTHDESNQNFEAMRAVFNGTRKVYIRTNFARDILAAVTFCKKYGAKMVLVGGDDSWRVADVLKREQIPVIIPRTHALPSREDEDVYLPYELPAKLKAAGVDFAITDVSFWQQRNTGFQAGTAAGFGLSKEEALSAITLNSAKILGIDKQTGSLEDGKDATLFVSDDDALEITGNNVTLAFIQGRQIDLMNGQKALYEKYSKKYGLKD